MSIQTLHNQLLSKGLVKQRLNTPSVKTTPRVRLLPRVNRDRISKAVPYRHEQWLGKSNWHGSFSNDSATITGQDWLTDLTITTALDYPGTLIYSVILNPFMMGASRLANEAMNWEYYRIEQMEFIYTSAKAIQDGAICGIVDNDPFDKPGNYGNILMNKNMSADSTYNTDNVSKTIIWNYKPEGPINKWRCDKQSLANHAEADETTDAGRFYVAIRNPLGISSTTTIGTIYIKYTVRFWKPQLELSANGNVTKYIISGATNSLPFGTNPQPESWSTVSFRQAPLGTTDYFELDAGTYLVTYAINAAAANVTALSIAVTAPYGGVITEKFKSWPIQLTAGTVTCQFVATGIAKVQIASTCADRTGASIVLYIVPLPANALTKTDRLSSKMNKILKTVEDLKSNFDEAKEENKDKQDIKEFDSQVVAEAPTVALSTSTSKLTKTLKSALFSK